MHLDIVFENDFFIVINKPSGLLSIPDRKGEEVSLKEILQQQYKNIFTVHRLDKGTSGIIVFAKDENTHQQLSKAFEERKTEKIYFGLVHGSVTPATATIDAPIVSFPNSIKMIVSAKGKPALTSYNVIEDFVKFSWLQFQIYTGRTHQIRVHAQYINHSIVCDELYGSAEPVYLSSIKPKYKLSKHEDVEKPMLARLALHASSLRFNFDDKEFFFEADLPKDIKALLQQLRKLRG